MVELNVYRGGEDEDYIVGKHCYANLYGINVDRGFDEEGLRMVVARAAEESNMKIVDLKSWRFGGRKGGVSVIAIVVESHIAVHTWPSYGYATVDVYTCGANSDPRRGIKIIIDYLEPREYEVSYVDRSQRRTPYD